MTNWREDDHLSVPAGKDAGGQFTDSAGAEVAARKAAGLPPKVEASK